MTAASRTAATGKPNAVLKAYQTLSPLPLGKTIFSRAVCWKAPYFKTIQPRIVELRPGRSVATMRKRHAVHNHLGTVHALAIGNLCEFVFGTAMEVSIPAHLRWIPKGMNIDYLAKAETDLTAEAEAPTDYPEVPAEMPVPVSVRDTGGKEVAKAVIRVWITAKK